MRHERANPLLSLGAVHEREAQGFLTIEGSEVSPLADRRGVRLAQEADVHRADIVALEQRRYAGAKWRAWATTDPLVRRQCGSGSACRWWGMCHQAPRDNQQREHGERRLENSRDAARCGGDTRKKNSRAGAMARCFCVSSVGLVFCCLFAVWLSV